MAGNANSGRKTDKLIRDALILAASRVHDGDPQGRKKLNVAAEAVVEAAIKGDIAAFKEMADRIDGKSPQSMDITTTHERAIRELSEPELEAIIARAGGVGGSAAEDQAGAPEPDRVH